MSPPNIAKWCFLDCCAHLVLKWSCSVVSDSVQPNGRYVIHQSSLSWSFPGKNTRVGLPFPSPGNLPNPRTEPGSPELQADSLPTESHLIFRSAQSLSRVWLFANPWIAARHTSLSNTNSQSLLKLMPIESVMPSSHLILCRPLLLLHWIPPSIRVFSSESTPRMRWPKYWSFSFSISSSNE